MKQKREQDFVANLVRTYFATHDALPELWDDVVGEVTEDWEHVRDTLAPEIERGDRRRELLHRWLKSFLPLPAQQRILENLDTLWHELRMAEADLAFIIGIEVGKHLATARTTQRLRSSA